MSVEISLVSDPEPCFAIRHTVFVQEQGIPLEMEQDALDSTAVHLLATIDSAPKGAARVVFNKDTAKIGRVCVLPESRGTGLGIALINAALDIAQKTPGISRAALGAQLDAVGFYEKLGFTPFGDIFDDAGVDHRMMELRFDT